LASVAHLSPAPYEILVIDDSRHAQKQSEDIVKSFVTRLPPTYFAAAPAHGIPYARNLGALHAKGDYIVYLDDDCTAPKNYLALFIRRLASQPTIGAINGMIINSTPDNIYAATQYAYYEKGLREAYPKMTKQPVADGRMLDCEIMGIRRNILLKHPFAVNRPHWYRNDDVELGRYLAASGIPILFDPSIVTESTPRQSLLPLLRTAWYNGLSDALTVTITKKSLRKTASITALYRWYRHEISRHFPHHRRKQISYAFLLLLFALTQKVARFMGYITLI
jgi:glycosyltransferase involved in cell wall biosynthesis